MKKRGALPGQEEYTNPRISHRKFHQFFTELSQQFQKKDGCEEALCCFSTLVLQCDVGRLTRRAKPRFMYREQGQATTGIGASSCPLFLSPMTKRRLTNYHRVL